MDKKTEEIILENQNNSEIAKAYSEDDFWEKVKKFALSAGKEVIEKALLLYYTLEEPNLPAWVKPVVIGALGYFIFPIDVIPDIIPVAGYTDDLGVLAAALGTVMVHVNDNVKAKAKAKLKEWFGE